ncbi:helix-turn-helix transcriptional regulator [uncultured Microbacterium sp.]|uniref:helix-turn-helix domain-containing protein n=1 Tax=uncultured Microbacterium sp. TaxID=191216 RepID=UPI00262DC770|nr:helix-turn-helix transcriptional regulator [uncultured Microbacterium sp.]
MFGARLKEIRTKRGLTAEALAERVGDSAVTKTVITNVESGRKRDLTTTELFLLSSALGVSPLTFAAGTIYDTGAAGADVRFAEAESLLRIAEAFRVQAEKYEAAAREMLRDTGEEPHAR